MCHNWCANITYANILMNYLVLGIKAIKDKDLVFQSWRIIKGWDYQKVNISGTFKKYKMSRAQATVGFNLVLKVFLAKKLFRFDDN